MNIHEYQGKEIMKQYGISVPRSRITFTVEEAVQAAIDLGCEVIAVKAQIHAGGRGKAGGVKITRSLEETKSAAEAILDKILITKQTGPEGKVVNQVLIEEGLKIEKECYLSCAVDSTTSTVVLIGSPEGGMDIEEVAEKTPHKIFKESIDPAIGLQQYQARRLAFNMGINEACLQEAAQCIMNIYRLFMEKDCSMVEINPLITTEEHKVVALDCKVCFDDNSLCRHPEILKYRDLTEEDPREVQASKYDLSYISLSGNIGCMVNGAGLAMATMDMIDHFGGAPANFLDVGGGATAEKVKEAFKILISDKKVAGIFVNIFGGIMKCDVIATGILQAVNALDLDVPLVVRLEGTNVELGKEILKSSWLDVITVNSMAEGAEKIVALVNGKGVVRDERLN
ncbi:succinyl-CoA synthetase, beta subunit [Alkaliphilus metalliredigens QYMF]|uniref:Succinate--CoA ligase [ADP-forming] subunit beta n=1 Tax=Alkaliphilus metalliredigens (strain QYMF) TaxID=293826 RepID=SUCC_ALKMQ|nr:ADP-forming succinate--CoA ligase subunit beta [Alkaliphilus metalliredigens]A6TKJ3.1 RecName: Full=Succinate--CoA ligase [ADP-forming] subunit beta; AltName: Full=Succinyl-CoA synthetase subunit beta; Short=SCS-beta [Alkaliphilus metalliredigens QYMF]ABR46711.1 succinyl-CoA synthetase, beta subunit [Alkaliphilus metalliredigens QYMF]